MNIICITLVSTIPSCIIFHQIIPFKFSPRLCTLCSACSIFITQICTTYSNFNAISTFLYTTSSLIFKVNIFVLYGKSRTFWTYILLFFLNHKLITLDRQHINKKCITCRNRNAQWHFQFLST